MGRRREFDLGSALDDVLSTFWTKGYEGTSVDDLCAAANLSKSSLYSAFGDKRTLLLQSLARYIDIWIGHIRKVVFSAESLHAALDALLAEIIEDVLAGPGQRGCFLGNCAAEIGRTDPEAKALVRKGMAAMEAIFLEALTKARLNNELPKAADVQALARFYVAGLQGLRLVGKVNPDRKVLQDIASVMITMAKPVG